MRAPSRRVSDPEMLRAALLNLAMNACQAAGKADVDVEIAAADGLCCIEVRDRGPGIPPEVRDQVFEPFFPTRTSGTGLGLAIVSRLIELQDGTITLVDRPSGGTIARVMIPIAPKPD
jgi:signal transduction histidine kinase